MDKPTPHVALISTRHRHFRLTPVTFQEYGAAVSDDTQSEIISVDPRVTNAMLNLLSLAQMALDNMEDEGFDVTSDIEDLNFLERIMRLEE